MNQENRVPKCPMGHEMELIQVAAGGWRYVCTRCATSFRAKKSTSCGWLSPIKSTKERAYDAATMRPLQKPLTRDEVVQVINAPVWMEFRNEFAAVNNAWALRLQAWDESYYLVGNEINGVINPRVDKYGQSWRCWASHPTDEERAAASWED